MDNINELRKIAKELRSLGEKDMASKVLFAIAAVTGGEKPQADLSYSFIMRELRKGDKGKVREFQEKFKKYFEEALDNEIEESANVALLSVVDEMGLSF